MKLARLAGGELGGAGVDRPQQSGRDPDHVLGAGESNVDVARLDGHQGGRPQRANGIRLPRWVQELARPHNGGRADQFEGALDGVIHEGRGCTVTELTISLHAATLVMFMVVSGDGLFPDKHLLMPFANGLPC